jgi:5-methylcytosine-specific restriction endonuclease McrA
MRAEQLRKEPLCRYCGAMGWTVPATTVDHVTPHKGDRNLAFDADNLQSLCKDCHDRHAQAKDKGQPVAGCDADGYPLDPGHKWSSDA